MNVLQAAILGVVEGLTEFLPVSSTGHLTVTEKLLGLQVDDPAVTGFTAVIQVGAIAAVLVYFRHDLLRFAAAWLSGLRSSEARGTHDYKFAWYVIWGSLPIGFVGFLAKDVIEGPLRNLWVVGVAFIGWSVVMWLAEVKATQARSESQVRLRDALVIGAAQCVALIPGVSRSGVTISTGLFLGLDRVAATRMSFFLSIPALTAAGLFTLPDALGGDVGALNVVVGTVVAFFVAYASIAWLLRFVSYHPITYFVWYRVIAGLVVIGLLGFGVITAT